MAPVQSRNLPFIWVIGQQNTGKKTHGDLIAQKFNFEHISVSEILKSDSEMDTPRGKLIDDCFKNNKKINDVLFPFGSLFGLF